MQACITLVLFEKMCFFFLLCRTFSSCCCCHDYRFFHCWSISWFSSKKKMKQKKKKKTQKKLREESVHVSLLWMTGGNQVYNCSSTESESKRNTILTDYTILLHSSIYNFFFSESVYELLGLYHDLPHHDDDHTLACMLTPLAFVSNKNNTIDPSVCCQIPNQFPNQRNVSHSLVSMSKWSPTTILHLKGILKRDQHPHHTSSSFST